MALSDRFTERDVYDEHAKLLAGLYEKTGDTWYQTSAKLMTQYAGEGDRDSCAALVRGVTAHMAERPDRDAPALMEVLSQPGGLFAGGSADGRPDGYKVDAATLRDQLPPGEWDEIVGEAKADYWKQCAPRDMAAAMGRSGSAVVVTGVPGAGKSTYLAGEQFANHVLYDPDVMDRAVMAHLAERGHLDGVTPLGTRIYGVDMPPHAMQRLFGKASGEVFRDLMENAVFPHRLPLAVHAPFCGPDYANERASLDPLVANHYGDITMVDLVLPRAEAMGRKNTQYFDSAGAWKSAQGKAEATLEERTGGKFMSQAGYAAGYDTFGGVPSNLRHSARALRDPALAAMRVVVVDTSGPKPLELLRTTSAEELDAYADRSRHEPATATPDATQPRTTPATSAVRAPRGLPPPVTLDGARRPAPEETPGL